MVLVSHIVSVLLQGTEGKSSMVGEVSLDVAVVCVWFETHCHELGIVSSRHLFALSQVMVVVLRPFY